MVIDGHFSYIAEPQLTNAQKGAIRTDSRTPFLYVIVWSSALQWA